MKFLSGTLMVIAVTLVAACTKKDTTVGPVTPAVNNAKPTAASISQQTLNFYPYTDTFVGSMATAFINPYEGGFSNNDNACCFLVTHLSQQVCIIQSAKPILVEQYQVSARINDTILISGNVADSGNLDFETYDHPYPYKNAVAFVFKGNSLSVSWDLQDVPLVGVCDWGESTGQYTGSLAPKRRQ